MKRSFCLFLSVMTALTATCQVSFISSFQHGLSLPLESKTVDGTHNSTALHLGNHLDFTFGNGVFTWGLGAYLGHIHALGVSDSYKETGLALARKYQLSAGQLQFSSSAFQSTQFLVGPVAAIRTGSLDMSLWAKGGYGLNEPGSYSVSYREGGTDQRIYAMNKGEEKNGLAYNFGAAVTYMFSPNIGMQLGAGYSSTRTNQINYNYDREKGVIPSFITADNRYIQASVGLSFRFNGSGCAEAGTAYRAINTSRSNVKSPSRMAERNTVTSPRDAASGLATGRRMHKPIVITKEIDKAAVTSPRDAASGLATGKRMHKPIVIRIAEEDDEAEASAKSGPRDAASGMATGKRMHKPLIIRIEQDEDESSENTLKAQNNNTVRSNRGDYITIILDGDDEEEDDEQTTDPLYQGKSINEKGIKRSSGGEEYRIIIKGKTRRRVEVLKSN